MNHSRAFTMVELILTIALTAIVLGAVAGIYGFATIRLSDAYTKSTLNDQLNGIADRIEATIRNADSCSTRDGGSTLKCSMPIDGVDTDGDGHYDVYYPDQTDSNGDGAYTVGHIMWIYNAGSTGVYASGSGNVWRADEPNGATPNSSTIDQSFAYYAGRILRYPLVKSVSFVVNAASRTVTLTLSGSTRIGAETAVGASDSTNSRTATLTRTVEWRN